MQSKVLAAEFPLINSLFCYLTFGIILRIVDQLLRPVLGKMSPITIAKKNSPFADKLPKTPT
ncbi:hypothetical protein DYBT9275_05643 [Dyadobacter sp. CECT 9275]|uniref:Uncharacterized protein n=1 Tax=Dyadobacter helix TaxID=2822344 RepID=A0A916N7H3_9BACT|nr:hypothetical protein DYBT9275_05643 [Dyadobacter sp. CECT 9275]